jgi:outer membrane lipoprotein SlyB
MIRQIIIAIMAVSLVLSGSAASETLADSTIVDVGDGETLNVDIKFGTNATSNDTARIELYNGTDLLSTRSLNVSNDTWVYETYDNTTGEDIEVNIYYNDTSATGDTVISKTNVSVTGGTSGGAFGSLDGSSIGDLTTNQLLLILILASLVGMAVRD